MRDWKLEYEVAQQHVLDLHNVVREADAKYLDLQMKHAWVSANRDRWFAVAISLAFLLGFENALIIAKRYLGG